MFAILVINSIMAVQPLFSFAVVGASGSAIDVLWSLMHNKMHP